MLVLAGKLNGSILPSKPKPEKLRGKSENQLIIKGAKKSRCGTKLSYYGAKKDGGSETTRKFYRAAKN